MRLNLPNIPAVFDAHGARSQQDELIRAMIPVVAQDEAVPFVHLRAADGGVWRVEVSGTGTLTTVKVQG